MLRTVAATRYVTPLREGGSLPALFEADDDGMYVVKFRGAGQGVKALIAELVCGALGRALDLPVPELVLVELDATLAAAEPDPEIQELLVASAGLNAGLDFLPAALPFNPAAAPAGSIDPALASAVVWFDGLTTNVDRTPRNPNLLVWHRRLWLIDHGAALYLQHAGLRPAEHADRPFPQLRDHVLLPLAGPLPEADERLAPQVTRRLLDEVVAVVPDAWLSVGEKALYAEYLARRAGGPRPWVADAEAARLAIPGRVDERSHAITRPQPGQRG